MLPSVLTIVPSIKEKLHLSLCMARVCVFQSAQIHRRDIFYARMQILAPQLRATGLRNEARVSLFETGIDE